MIGKVFYSIILGIIGAGILHAVIILLMPSLSANHSWILIKDKVEIGVPTPIDNSFGGNDRTLFLDPLFEHAICRFDLTEGTMRVNARGNTLMWTIAAFDETGTIYFSANDRIANSKNVDIAIVNAEQLRFVRQNTPDELAQSIIASSQSNKGYALLRVFAPDPSWKKRAKDMLDSMQCEFLVF